MKKKFLALALTLCLAMTMIPGVAMAADVTVTTEADLKAAVEVDGNNITLGGNIALSGTLTIPVGKTITLNLGGYTLSYTTNVAGATALIKNEGTLTIFGPGTISNVATNPDSNWEPEGFPTYANNTITNCGTLTVNGATIENGTSGQGAYFAIDNNSGNRDAILTINSGTISCTNYRAIRQFANSTSYQNKVTINNGTIYGTKGGVWVHDPNSKNNIAVLEIKGGDISGDTQAIQVWDAHGGETSNAPTSIENIDIKISGGNVEGPVLIYFSEEPANDGTTLAAKGAEFKVSGGTFTDSIVNNLLASDALAATINDGTEDVYAVGQDAIEEAAEEAADKAGAENVTVTVTQGDVAFEEDDLPGGVTVKNSGTGDVTVDGNTPDSSAGIVVPTPVPQTPAKPASSGIKVKYEGGNSFSTSKSAVPTGVEIDGVPVSFTGNGKNFTVSCINPDAKWVTVRWNSTTVTVNFTPDAASYCTTVSIPKTGDVSVVAYAVMAVVAAAGAMRRK